MGTLISFWLCSGRICLVAVYSWSASLRSDGLRKLMFPPISRSRSIGTVQSVRVRILCLHKVSAVIPVHLRVDGTHGPCCARAYYSILFICERSPIDGVYIYRFSRMQSVTTIPIIGAWWEIYIPKLQIAKNTDSKIYRYQNRPIAKNTDDKK